MMLSKRYGEVTVGGESIHPKALMIGVGSFVAAVVYALSTGKPEVVLLGLFALFLATLSGSLLKGKNAAELRRYRQLQHLRDAQECLEEGDWAGAEEAMRKVDIYGSVPPEKQDRYEAVEAKLMTRVSH